MSDPRQASEQELVEFLRSVEVTAPQSLHRSVAALTAPPSGRGCRARAGARRTGAGAWRGLAPAALALAALAVVAVLVLSSGGGSKGLTVRQASALTLRGATSPPPSESARNHSELAASVQGVAFPYWGERFGWRASGQRVDVVGGRQVRTIIYSDGHGARIGYAIIAGAAPKVADSGTVLTRGGVRYRLLAEGDVRVVSWVRNGHLCVVSGRRVGSATLLRLASWGGRGLLAA